MRSKLYRGYMMTFEEEDHDDTDKRSFAARRSGHDGGLDVVCSTRRRGTADGATDAQHAGELAGLEHVHGELHLVRGPRKQGHWRTSAGEDLGGGHRSAGVRGD